MREGEEETRRGRGDGETRRRGMSTIKEKEKTNRFNNKESNPNE